MSLTIHCQEHFDKVVAFAIQQGCLLKLAEWLDYLSKYGEGDNQCELYYDWAPNSFALLMKRADGSMLWNGGLIYSGPGQPLDGSSPAFTVGIDTDNSKHIWSVHT